MTAKRKAAFPSKAGTLEKTALNNCRKNIKKPTKRQQVKRHIVWLAVVGILPVFAAEWLIRRGGLKHD